MNIAEIAAKRFTTKNYDPTKKIPEHQIKQLCSVLRNSPSSVNSQPWHFLVISSTEGKQKILPAVADLNHDRITDASHVIIFCAKTPLTQQHLLDILNQEDKDNRFTTPDLKEANNNGRHYFVGLNSDTPENQLTWESKQIYIALGNLLLAATCLDINSTPIEGFDIAKLNQILDLKNKGLTSIVIASLGYHSDQDFNSKLPKSRLPEQQLFTFM